MNRKDRFGTIAPSWFRLQWRRLIALLDDHPVPAVTMLLVIVFGVGFYATQLKGVSHFRESFSRWRVESFGGIHEVDRAVRMPDVILSFKPRGYDRLDAMVMTSIHFGGTAFRDELRALAARGGIIRIVVLDPRIAEPNAAKADAFADLAGAFGEEPWVLRAKCWYSTAVIVRLSQELGDNLQLRLISKPLSQAEHPYFAPGRSSSTYLSDDPDDRLDVIVPRIDPKAHASTLAHPARVVIDRPDHPDVEKFSAAFEEAWKEGVAVDESLAEELMKGAAQTRL